MTTFLTEQCTGHTVIVFFSLQLLLQKFLFPPDVRSNASRTSYKTSVIFFHLPQNHSTIIAVKDLEFDENVLSGSNADGEECTTVNA